MQEKSLAWKTEWSVFIPYIYLDVEDRVLSTCVTVAFLHDNGKRCINMLHRCPFKNLYPRTVHRIVHTKELVFPITTLSKVPKPKANSRCKQKQQNVCVFVCCLIVMCLSP